MLNSCVAPPCSPRVVTIGSDAYAAESGVVRRQDAVSARASGAEDAHAPVRIREADEFWRAPANRSFLAWTSRGDRLE
jgi:hypothetical protein